MLEEVTHGYGQHTFQDRIFSIYYRLQGMETETKFLLGLGVPELDRGMETIIFG